jgi:hypothetical protein
MYSLFSLGDSAAALAATLPRRQTEPGRFQAAMMFAAQMRGDFETAARWTDSAPMSQFVLYSRFLNYVAWKQMDSAEVTLADLRRHGRTQNLPSALLLHATAIAPDPAHQQRARRYARDALDWLATADLSPPANARIAERVACIAAWTKDVRLLADTRRFLRTRDAGRDLRSYRIVLTTVDAADAFIAGRYEQASAILTLNLRNQYFGRSIATIALLNGDALGAAGNTAGSRAAYTSITTLRVPDHNTDVWVPVRTLAAERLRQQAAASAAAGATR